MRASADTTAVPGRVEQGLVIALFILTVVLFWPATGGDFMNLDDYPYVKDNPMVWNGVTLDGIRQACTTVREQWWLPLLWISYMADVELFGTAPYGHHLVNILLHAANAALLFWVLFRMTGARWRSLFVALLFAWHPTRVEAVAWIAARKDVLSGLFFMLALLAYVRHAEKPSGWRMGLVFLALLAGLMSKATLVALPCLLLVLDAWPLQRPQCLAGRPAWKSWVPLVREKIPLLLLAGVFMAINLRTHVSGTGADGAVAPLTRLGEIAPNLLVYLKLLAVPWHLNILYPEHDVVSWPVSIGAALAVAAAGVWVLRRRARQPYLLTGGLWFALLLAPVVRGVRVGLAQYADRWSYLPLIGVGLALAWWGTDWSVDRRWRRNVLRASAVVLLGACAFLTHSQLGWWRDPFTMFQRAVQLEPESHVVRNGLGQALVAAGRIEEGRVQLQEAVRLKPDDADYLTNLGTALFQLGRFEEALARHDEAIRQRKSDAVLYNNRGNALAALGRKDEAWAAYEEALRLQPGHPEANYNLGGLLFAAGQVDAALAHFQAAVQARPDGAPIWYNLGITYAQLGRYAEAEACVQKALALEPALPGAPEMLRRLQTMPR